MKQLICVRSCWAGLRQWACAFWSLRPVMLKPLPPARIKNYNIYIHIIIALACFLLVCPQEQVKGSQGAGKVDEALDRGAKADKGDEGDKGKAGAKPQLPSRPAGKGKGGRR